MTNHKYAAWWQSGGEIEGFDTIEECREWLKEMNTVDTDDGQEIDLDAECCFIAEIKEDLIAPDSDLPFTTIQFKKRTPPARTHLERFDDFKKAHKDEPLTEYLFGYRIKDSIKALDFEIEDLQKRARSLQGMSKSIPKEDLKAAIQMVQEQAEAVCGLRYALDAAIQRDFFGDEKKEPSEESKKD